jgi:hypothetical protein
MLPDFPQRYRITIIGNSANSDFSTVERSVLAGTKDFIYRELGLIYPQDVFSFSHISLPFPVNDSLYGSMPDPIAKDEFGLNLGLISNAQGERSVLGISTNLFFRISSNPLFSYLTERINDVIEELQTQQESSEIKDVVNSKTKFTQEEYDAIMKEMDFYDRQFWKLYDIF